MKLNTLIVETELASSLGLDSFTETFLVFDDHINYNNVYTIFNPYTAEVDTVNLVSLFEKQNTKLVGSKFVNGVDKDYLQRLIAEITLRIKDDTDKRTQLNQSERGLGVLKTLI